MLENINNRWINFGKTAVFKMLCLIVFVIFTAQTCNRSIDCNKNCNSTGPVMIYKTTKDYSNNVFVMLDDSKTNIVAFPGPQDVLNQKPIKLSKGYLLKKMLGNAVLSITIDDYATGKYDKQKLENYIIDKEPFTEIYECCKCVGKDIDEINAIIKHRQLTFCDSLVKY